MNVTPIKCTIAAMIVALVIVHAVFAFILLCTF